MFGFYSFALRWYKDQLSSIKHSKFIWYLRAPMCCSLFMLRVRTDFSFTFCVLVSFRGRILKGENINVPDGYNGMVIILVFYFCK